MEHHLTSGKRKTSKGTRVRRETKIKHLTETDYQLAQLTNEDEQMLSDIENYLKVKMLRKQRLHKQVKKFLVSSIILGWKIHENKKKIESIKKSLKELYEQNSLQQDHSPFDTNSTDTHSDFCKLHYLCYYFSKYN